MASIVKREGPRGVSYLVRYRLDSGEQRSKAFRTKKEAEAFASITEADKVRGELIDPRSGKVTFADWWAEWWPTTVNLRASTRARDESYARNHLLPHFGPVALSDIDHMAVKRWVADLSASGLAPATVVKAAQIFGKAIGAAVDAGRIRTDPTARVELPKVEREEMRFLTPDEVATLVDSMAPQYRALVLVGAYCGLRIGELAGLKRDRVDLLRRRLEVAEIATEVRGHIVIGPPKTRAGRRSVPIPRFVADALAEHLAVTSGDIVFPSPDGGYLRSNNFRRRYWHPAVTAAGLDGLTPHALRHTAVAFWIDAEASPKEIAARAGHASVVTVLDRYGHRLPGTEDKVTDALDAMGRGASAAPAGNVRALVVHQNDSEAGNDEGQAEENAL